MKPSITTFRVVTCAVLACALGAAVGCADIDADGPRIQAGTTVADGDGFLAIDDGAEVELQPGAQGGFHLWVNIRAHGLAGEYYLERDARLSSDDTLVSRAIPQYLAIADDAMDDWWDSPEGMPSFMCPSPLGIKVFDEAIYFDIRVLDDDERIVAEDRLTVIPRCPQGAQADFCREICSGEA